MIYQVSWTEIARHDLNEIVRYIAADNVNNALNVLEKLEAKATSLEQFPERGRLLPELVDTGITQYRELLISPWRIIYRMELQQVFVTAVLDGRRDLQSLLLQRLSD